MEPFVRVDKDILEDGEGREEGMDRVFSQNFAELTRVTKYTELRNQALKGSKRLMHENPARCWFNMFRMGRSIATGHTAGKVDSALGRIDELTRLTTVAAMLPVGHIQYSYLIDHPRLGNIVHVWTVGKKVAALESWRATPSEEGEDKVGFEPMEHDEVMGHEDIQLIASRFGTFNAIFVTGCLNRHDPFRELSPDRDGAIGYLRSIDYEIEVYLDPHD